MQYSPDNVDVSQEAWVILDADGCVLALQAGGEQRFGDDAPKMVFEADDVQEGRAALIRRGLLDGAVRAAVPGVLVCDGLDPEASIFQSKCACSHGEFLLVEI